jgi:hypothetical protein
MDEQVLERRMLLRGAGVAGATVLGGAALASPAAAHERRVRGGLVGAYLITHKDDPPGDTTPVLAVAALSAGGVLTTQDLHPASTAGLGAWWPDRNHRFRATFWTGFNGHGTEPAVVIRIKIRGRVNGDRISGTHRFTVYDASKHSKLDSGTGTFSGHRIDS